MDIRLDDRVALVTGASSGIGQAAALALAEAGAHVVVQGHSHMVYLASDAADFVTGQIMFVDGGYSVW